MMVVVLLLKQKLLGGNVGGKSNNGNAKAGSGALESVSSSEVGLVSPGLSVVSVGVWCNVSCRLFGRVFRRLIGSLTR